MDIFKVCKGDDLYNEFLSCKCGSSLHNKLIKHTPVRWLKEYEMCSEEWERESYYAILTCESFSYSSLQLKYYKIFTCDKYINYMEYMNETDFTINIDD